MEGEKKNIRFYLNFIPALGKIICLRKILSLSNIPGNAASDSETLPQQCFNFWKGLKIIQHLLNKVMFGFDTENILIKKKK